MAEKKIYRSANGQEIDMQRILLQNEEVRAVGNMNVNARGDVIDNGNATTSSRSSQVNKGYRKQTGNIAQDLPIGKKAVQPDNAVIVGLDETVAEVLPVKKAKASSKKEAAGGLAGAIAKARESNGDTE